MNTSINNISNNNINEKGDRSVTRVNQAPRQSEVSAGNKEQNLWREINRMVADKIHEGGGRRKSNRDAQQLDVSGINNDGTRRISMIQQVRSKSNERIISLRQSDKSVATPAPTAKEIAAQQQKSSILLDKPTKKTMSIVPLLMKKRSSQPGLLPDPTAALEELTGSTKHVQERGTTPIQEALRVFQKTPSKRELGEVASWEPRHRYSKPRLRRIP
jgi:hypothetical protein